MMIQTINNFIHNLCLKLIFHHHIGQKPSHMLNRLPSMAIQNEIPLTNIFRNHLHMIIFVSLIAFAILTSSLPISLPLCVSSQDILLTIEDFVSLTLTPTKSYSCNTLTLMNLCSYSSLCLLLVILSIVFQIIQLTHLLFHINSLPSQPCLPLQLHLLLRINLSLLMGSLPKSNN